MTSEHSSGGLSDEAMRRQQMLEALADAVEGEDYEFSTELAGQQNMLRPFEVAEYMDVKRRHVEDPVEQRRWKDALHSFLQSLSGQTFPLEEIEAIKDIVDRLEFDSITSNIDEVVDEQQANEEDESYEEKDDDEDWEEDNFGVEMTQEEIDRVRKMPVFTVAENHAKGSSVRSPNLQTAIEHVQSLVSGQLADSMRRVLDWYVYKRAENYAQGSSVNSPDLDMANGIIEEFSSSEEVAERMRAAIDKYVFKRAEFYAYGSSVRSPDMAEARHIIDYFASRPGRRDAMLRRLGFM